MMQRMQGMPPWQREQMMRRMHGGREAGSERPRRGPALPDLPPPRAGREHMESNHIHVQRPGTPNSSLSGEPLQIRFKGRYVARSAFARMGKNACRTRP